MKTVDFEYDGREGILKSEGTNPYMYRFEWGDLAANITFEDAESIKQFTSDQSRIKKFIDEVARDQ